MALFTFRSPVETHSPLRVAQFLSAHGLAPADGVSINADGFTISADLPSDPSAVMAGYADAPTGGDQADARALAVLQQYIAKYGPMGAANSDDVNAILALCRLARRMAVS